MKLLILNNSKATTPATFNPANAFKCNFNKIVELPRFCQMCIVHAECTDASAPALRYIALNNVPIKTALGNGRAGNESKILGSFITDVDDLNKHTWIDLDNPAKLKITDLDVAIVNQDNVLANGLSGLTEVVLGYRPDPSRR